MEAERKNLANQIDYATVNVTLREEYRAQLPGSSEPAPIRFRNAAVQGYRGVVDVSTGIIVFLLSYGPALMLWPSRHCALPNRAQSRTLTESVA
jgi:hypothetical protein